jgi:hypothetical protein
VLVVALLFWLAIVLLANVKTRFSTGLQLRVMGLTVSLILVLSALIGCGTLSNNSNGGFSGTPAGTGTGGGGSTTTATSVSKVTVNPSSVAAGSSPTATVTLNAPAPAGGAQVKLTSSNASAASVPASVTVPAGKTSVDFAVATGNVSSDTSVLITASYNNTVASITVSVKAPVTPPSTSVSISISPSSAALLAGASQQFTATVTGSTNASVSWTTTGGNITNTGLFTAPNVSASTIVTVYATSQADPSVVKTAQVTVTPVSTPPPSGGGTYSGTGPVASWNAYQYRDTDNLYHQAIEIDNAKGLYPVIGYSYLSPGCTDLGDTFNDFWQPIGNGLWWFINQPSLVYVKWVWYNNATDRQILQQTPCIDYSGAPKFN